MGRKQLFKTFKKLFIQIKFNVFYSSLVGWPPLPPSLPPPPSPLPPSTVLKKVVNALYNTL